jgi:predicted metal-dependent hydrolase
MIKTVVIPKDNTLHLHIPNKYVGKEIEVFLYAKDELIEQYTNKTKNAARFKGLLTSEEADRYHAYLKQARSEWDRNI